MNDPAEAIRARLAMRNVSPAIIDRVIRLNPNPHKGLLLRGIHYKSFDDPRTLYGLRSKGEVIRKHGRVAFERIPRDRLSKRGKRVYVTEQAVHEHCGPPNL